jgi:Cellulose-binding protein Sde0182, C-terminal domain
MSSVYRWRPAFQADFAARLDWCVKPFKKANHPPVVRISNHFTLPVKPGEVVTLNAIGTTDPDGDDLAFEWSIYPHDPEIATHVTVHSGKTPTPRVEVTPTLAGKTIPILLTVRDNGTPRLTRYRRVLLRVEREANLDLRWRMRLRAFLETSPRERVGR